MPANPASTSDPPKEMPNVAVFDLRMNNASQLTAFTHMLARAFGYMNWSTSPFRFWL